MKPLSPTAENEFVTVATKPLSRGLSAHILPTSATMIGVCMTVLTIGHLSAGNSWRMVIDKLLAVDALIFLLSAILSFISMKFVKSGTSYETRAEMVFISALSLLALGAFGLVFFVR